MSPSCPDSRDEWDAWERELSPAVRALARRFAGVRCEAEDLEQAGWLAAWRAARRYDPRLGGIRSYALPFVEGAMRHYRRDYSLLIRVPAWAWERERRAPAVVTGGGSGPDDLADRMDAAHHTDTGEVEQAAVEAWMLAQVRARLRARQWSVFRLMVLQEYSAQRAGVALGLSETCVRTYLSLAVRRLQRAWAGIGAPVDMHDEGRLTRRQREVLRLLASGKSTREIGEALCISKRTVDEHLRCIYISLRVHGAIPAVIEGMKRGVVPLPRVYPEETGDDTDGAVQAVRREADDGAGGGCGHLRPVRRSER